MKDRNGRTFERGLLVTCLERPSGMVNGATLEEFVGTVDRIDEHAKHGTLLRIRENDSYAFRTVRACDCIVGTTKRDMGDLLKGKASEIVIGALTSHPEPFTVPDGKVWNAGLQRMIKQGFVIRLTDTRGGVTLGIDPAEMRQVLDAAGYNPNEGEEKMAAKRKRKAAPKQKRQALEPNENGGKCLCGCGTPVSRNFAPGHDAKLYGMMKRVLDGTEPKEEREAARVRKALTFEAVSKSDKFRDVARKLKRAA